jgi:hypothetical protein
MCMCMCMCRTRANGLKFSTINSGEGGSKTIDRCTSRPESLFSFAVYLCCGLKNIGRTEKTTTKVEPKRSLYHFMCKKENGLKFSTIDRDEGKRENIECRTRIRALHFDRQIFYLHIAYSTQLFITL